MFDNEVHTGRILHPFINPIIARAESQPSLSKECIYYLMYPYMKNGNLRHNIDRENNGERLWTVDSNSKIWTRCIYQIFQVMNYLHKPVESVRGPVFLRYLTSRSIFLDENFSIKIGDVGVAMEAELNTDEVKCTETVQTDYHPPAPNIKYTASNDIFSAGVVILEILTGENATLNGDQKFLYEKYNCDGGEKYLIEDSKMRSREKSNAQWTKKHHRNTLAEIAVNAVCSRGTMDEFIDKLDVMHLESAERYRGPKNSDRCVSCHVNPRG